MSGPQPPGRFLFPTERAGRDYRRRLALGLMASVALHLLVFLAWRAPLLPAPEGSAVASASSPPGGLRVVELRSAAPAGPPRPAEAVDRARPVPVERSPEVEVRDAAPSRGRLDLRPVAAGGGGPAAAVFAAGYEGGDGPAGAGTRPPVPRTLLPQWSPPGAVRGSRVTVRVEVDSAGRPTGRVELVPPTPDPEFNELLRREMTRVDYLPARRGGRPVGGWAEITFQF